MSVEHRFGDFRRRFIRGRFQAHLDQPAARMFVIGFLPSWRRAPSGEGSANVVISAIPWFENGFP